MQKAFALCAPLLAEGLKEKFHINNCILYHQTFFVKFPKKIFVVKKFWLRLKTKA